MQVVGWTRGVIGKMGVSVLLMLAMPTILLDLSVVRAISMETEGKLTAPQGSQDRATANKTAL